jgi:hypothetical protein
MNSYPAGHPFSLNSFPHDGSAQRLYFFSDGRDPCCAARFAVPNPVSGTVTKTGWRFAGLFYPAL